MKKQFYTELKVYLRGELLKSRDRLNITQEEMAYRLLMSSRAYASLESGKSCCSLITVLLYLSRCCLDKQAFIEGLLDIFSDSEIGIR